MHPRRLLLIGLALLLTLRLAATSVEPPALDSLLQQSGYVIRAVVKSATPQWQETDGQRYISTRVEFELREVIKGTPPAPLVLEFLGGRIGDEELTVTGMPALRVGDEHILFVHGGQQRLFPLVAMMHGLYPVLRESRTGEDLVLRSNGRPLYSADEVALPMERASSVPQQNPSARPLTAKAFIQQLRTRAAALAPTREN
jgi:hypothetical protein